MPQAISPFLRLPGESPLFPQVSSLRVQKILCKAYRTDHILWQVILREHISNALVIPRSYHQWSAGYRKHRCDGHRFPLSVARLVAARLRRFGRLERYAAARQ